jgi:hypothetical protein
MTAELEAVPGLALAVGSDQIRRLVAAWLIGYESKATRRNYAYLCRERHNNAYADAPVMPRRAGGGFLWWDERGLSGITWRVRARRGRRACCRGLCSGRVWCR